MPETTEASLRYQEQAVGKSFDYG